MNRRQKIIVSVTGIFLVLLILVGLTYAYFLTRIDGNEANKSISVTTKNLHLTYSDGNGELTFANAIVPGDSIKFKKSDGTETYEKTFSVRNNGDDTEYVVFVDDISITYAADVGETIKQGDTTTFESNDFRFTLTCTITSSDSTRNNTSCNSVEKGTLPLVNESILVGNEILKGDVHNYVLTMEYIETGRNQSNDMNKTLSALINIEDINRLNPYKENTDSLAYNIIENAKNNSNGTNLVAQSSRQIASEAAGTNFLKATDPTTFEDSYSTSYYIAYASDYSVNPATGLFNLGTEDSPVTIVESGYSYSEELANTLAGKYAIFSTNEFTEKSFVDRMQIYKISPTVSDTLKVERMDRWDTLQVVGTGELSVTLDDYGTSYYYRGNIQNNYVTFAQMCWRIVRIKGNGNIKLILEDKDNICEEISAMTSTVDSYNNDKGDFDIAKKPYGFTEQDIADYLGYESGMADEFKNYQTTLAKKIDLSLGEIPTTEQVKNTLASKLEVGDWCNTEETKYDSDYETILTQDQINDKISNYDEYFYYDSYVRLFVRTPKEPTLKCNGTIMTKFKDNTDMYIGTLTADEIAYAGGAQDIENKNFYLMNDYVNIGREKGNYINWLTLSPYNFYTLDGDSVFIMDYYGEFTNSLATDINSLRPVITLKSATVITDGIGTIDDPYIIG